MPGAQANVSLLWLPGGEGLEQHEGAWRRLAANALEPNPFYEPALLLPALRSLRGEAQVDVALVFLDEAGADARLIGLYPLERRGSYRGAPLASLRLWKHLHCFLCTPLVDAAHAGASLGGLLAGLRAAPRAALLELDFCAADGPFAAVLAETLRAQGPANVVTDTHSRALFRPAASVESYLAEALPPRKRREFERLARRLAEHGRLEFSELAPGEDPRPWIDAFLELEASGWKGRDGTAIALSPDQRRFFEQGATALAAEGRLWMLGLALDGKWIALKCNFLAGRGGFAFKIAYDEQYARSSPGVLLELETLARLHRRPEIAWMDSCAIEGHFLKNRLWLQRREIATRLIAIGGAGSRLFVGALPIVQRVKRALRRLAQRVAGPEETAKS
jgi:CelD/BcsL family acetyltransferase involved in cellulose biosynthesis